jgi:hypothetical protein
VVVDGSSDERAAADHRVDGAKAAFSVDLTDPV